MEDIKERVKDNASENIRSLVAREDTTFYMWSGIDMELKCSVDARIEKLKPLLNIFCNPKIHEVLEMTEDYENNYEEKIWRGYTVFLHHPKKLLSPKDEVIEELKYALSSLGKKWLNAIARSGSNADQMKVLSEFCAQSSAEFPNTCLLIQIMMANPANSSAIERSYSILEIICAKRRNRLTAEHIEAIYLLAVMKLQVKNVHDYIDCIRYLEK